MTQIMPFRDEYRCLQQVWQLVGAFKTQIFLAMLFRGGQSLLLAIAFYMAAILCRDLILGENYETNQIIWFVVVMGGLLLGQLVFSYLSALLSWDICFSIGRDMRLMLISRLKKLSLGFHLSRHKGETVTALTTDVAMIEGFISTGMPKLVHALAMPLILWVCLACHDLLLALSFLISPLCAIIALYWIGVRFQAIGPQWHSVKAEAASKMIEYVEGNHIVRTFNQIDQGQALFEKSLRQFRDISIKMVLSLVMPLISFVIILLLGLALVTSCLGYWDMAAGDMIITLFLLLPIYYPLTRLVTLIEHLKITHESVIKINEILTAPLQNFDADKSVSTETDICFENVSFGYQSGTDILKNVSFRVPAASMTAIVGPSGSGKTTILNLIARFWDVTAGQIHIGNVDIQTLNPDHVNQMISYVFQDDYLFKGTIYDNIAVGAAQASAAQIEAAARLAQAHDFIMALPDQYQTNVGEGGLRLSGGERQRISIARAILKDAPIILLDEATSALDAHNDQALQKALANLVQHKTLIVVAHKLSTIEAADQILLLKNGRIVESGTHAALLAGEGTIYRQMTDRKSQAENWSFTNRRR